MADWRTTAIRAVGVVGLLMVLKLAGSALSLIPPTLLLGTAGFLAGWYLSQRDSIRLFFRNRRSLPTASLSNTQPLGGPPGSSLKRKADAITSSQGVDEQLRALIELVCMEFIDNWYPSISSDVEFRETIKWAMAHAMRSVEERVMAVRLPDLVKDMAYLLTVHMEDFSDARKRHNSAFTAGLSIDDIFARRQPHFALQDTATEHEYLRQVCAWLVFNVLPSGERSSQVVRLLLREIIASKILIPVVDKFSDPDFMNDIMIDLLTPSIPGADVARPFIKPTSRKKHVPSAPSSAAPAPASTASSSSASPKTYSPPPKGEVELSLPSTSMTFISESPPPPASAHGTPTLSPGTTGGPLQKSSSLGTMPSSVSEIITPPAPESASDDPQEVSPGLPLDGNVEPGVLAGMKEGWSLLMGLRTADNFGPLRPSDYQDESLDEPLYALLNSFFRVSESPQGWLYYLTLYGIKPVLQFVGGDVINRGILYGLHWLTSERRMAYYLYLLREALWPGGRWAPDAEKLTTEKSGERKERFREMLNEFLAPMRAALGDSVVDRARDDIVEVLQHKTLNKHFLFVALDVLLAHVFPEMVSASVLPYLPSRPIETSDKATPLSNAMAGPENVMASDASVMGKEHHHHRKDKARAATTIDKGPLTATAMKGILAPSTTLFRRDILSM